MAELNSPPLPEDYRIANLFGPKSTELRHELAGFWLKHGALKSRERALGRVDEVLFAIRTARFEVAAVSTVYEKHHPELGFNLYHFRCFVAPEHRRHLLARILLVSAARFLNERFVAGHTPDVRGMYLEVENADLQRERVAAVWTSVPFVYIGKNAQGAHLRVFYFDGARID